MSYYSSSAEGTTSSLYRRHHYELGTTVTVKAPATSANLGCGFDSFGIALDLWLTLTVTVSTSFKFTFIDQEKYNPDLPTDGNNAIVLAFLVGLRHLRALPSNDTYDFSFICDNQIPVGRGLGSSASAIVAGLGAAFAITGRSLSDPAVKREISVLACRRESHPDNVLPAIFGEMQIGVIRTQDDVRLCIDPEHCGIGDYIMQTIPFPQDDITCLIYIPPYTVNTNMSRKKLPAQYTLSDSVSNIGRAAILVACILLRDYANLRFAVGDRLHQPFRSETAPEFEVIRDALPVTDALAVYLSGSGPSVVVFCRSEDAQHVQEDLTRLCWPHSAQPCLRALKVSHQGVHACCEHLRTP